MQVRIECGRRLTQARGYSPLILSGEGHLESEYADTSIASFPSGLRWEANDEFFRPSFGQRECRCCAAVGRLITYCPKNPRTTNCPTASVVPDNRLCQRSCRSFLSASIHRLGRQVVPEQAAPFEPRLRVAQVPPRDGDHRRDGRSTPDRTSPRSPPAPPRPRRRSRCEPVIGWPADVGVNSVM